MDETTTELATKIVQPLDATDLLTLVVVVAVSVTAVFLVERFVPPLVSRIGARARSMVLPWIPVFRLTVLGLAALLIIPIVIVPSTENLIAIVGAGAVAIGFAFKDYLTSILAGIVVLFERPYRQGDWVRIGDVYGEVREMGMRSLGVVTADDDRVTIPHGHIWTAPVVNANDGAVTLQCVADFYLHPDHDAARLQQALHDSALASPWIDVSKPVAVLVSERPWGTHYRVRAYPISAADQFRLTSDVTVRGKAAIARLGAHPAAAPVTATA